MEELERGISRISIEKNDLKREFDKLSWEQKRIKEVVKHMKHVVLGELKTKSGKNLFRKLNEHSKELQARQEEIAKKHNALSVKYEELEHLKNNMNEYLGRDKREKKESVIGAIEKHKVEDREKLKEKKEIIKEFERF